MPGEPTAVIGKSVQIRGELKGNEDLVIEGLVEGTITLSENRLTVGANARVTANVTARDVVVQGSLQGDIHAAGRVELRTGSHVNGDIRGCRWKTTRSSPARWNWMGPRQRRAGKQERPHIRRVLLLARPRRGRRCSELIRKREQATGSKE